VYVMNTINVFDMEGARVVPIILFYFASAKMVNVVTIPH
jgi:hypothetical protein